MVNCQTASPKPTRPFFRVLAGILALVILLVFILGMYELVVEGSSDEIVGTLFLSFVSFYILSCIIVTGYPPGTKVEVEDKVRYKFTTMLVDDLYFISRKCKKKNGN